VTWLGFANPLWLAGLAALTVPLVIHLLSRGRQLKVPMGSVRWLAPALTLTARRIRLSRWLLLLVRCSILACVATALAWPRLALEPTGEVTAWVLVDPDLVRARPRLEAVDPEAYRAMDHVVAQGGEVRWLTTGLPGGALETPPENGEGDLWSLLHEADAAASSDIGFEVFALDRADRLRGVRPRVARGIVWHSITDPGMNRWIERAVGREDDLTVFVGESDPSGTRFRRFDVGGPRPAATVTGSGLAVDRGPGLWTVTLAEGGDAEDDDGVDVPVRGRDTRATIFYSAERSQDASYLNAGLGAVGRALGGSLIVRREIVDRASEQAEPDPGSLVFWLAAEPMPESLKVAARGGATVVSDALSRSAECDCLVSIGGSPNTVRFDRLGPADESSGSGVTLWRSTSGEPVLEAEPLGEGLWVRFHSRFNRGWTDLVEVEDFPRWLLALALEIERPQGSARRVSSDRRSAPGQGRPAGAGTAVPFGNRGAAPLAPWLWAMAAVLTCWERWLVARISA